MARYFQGIFRRHDTYVVVRPIKVGADKTLAPGSEISRKDFRVHRLQHWHRRRMIGAKGSPWVDEMLKLAGTNNPRPEITMRPSRIAEKQAQETEQTGTDENAPKPSPKRQRGRPRKAKPANAHPGTTMNKGAR